MSFQLHSFLLVLSAIDFRSVNVHHSITFEPIVIREDFDLLWRSFFSFFSFFEMNKSMKKRVHCLFDWKIIWIKKSICKLSSTSGQWHLFSPSCEQSNKIHLKFAVCASFRWYSHRLHCSIRSVTYRNTYTHIYTDTPTSSLLSSR